MGKCLCHPEIESSYICLKDNVYLCEECLSCRNPDIYCKFRESCPIWFLEKKGFREESETTEPAFNVVFNPDGKQITVPQGTTLLKAAQMAGVHLNASCNGKGACGKCKLVHEAGTFETVDSPLLSDKEKEKGYFLACLTKVHGDMTVRIPEEALEKKLKVAGLGEEATAKLQGLVNEIRPMMEEIPLELSPPTLDDSVSDLDRLTRGLKKAGVDPDRLNVGLSVMRDLAATLRDDHWKVTAAIMRKKCAIEVLGVRPGNGSPPSLGLAVDVGTTSIVVYLVDMIDGNVLAATSGHNRQAACGDDVINRIVCAEKDGVGKLSRMVLATINSLIGEALDGAGAREKWGMAPGTGPEVIITNKAVLKFDADTKEAYLASYHPDCTIEEILANTPWDLKVAEDVHPTLPPTDKELRALREVLDPHRMISIYEKRGYV